MTERSSEPVAGDDVAARVRSLSRELADHVRRGAVAEALQLADVLLGVDDAALAAGDPATVRDLLDAAGMVVEARELASAEQLLVKGINALSSNPRATEVDLLIPLSNLMSVYDQGGDPSRRDQIGAMIGGLAERIDAPLPRNAMLVFLQLGRIYSGAGQMVAALVMYGQVHRYMTGLAESDPETLYGWLLHYGAALRTGGRYDEAVEVCRQALATLDRLPDADRADAIEIHLTIAAAATAKGDRTAAEQALEDAVRTAEAEVDDTAPAGSREQAAAGAAYHNLATLYLEQGYADRYPRAEELVRRSLAIVLRSGRAGSAEHAGELGHLGVIAEKRGDVEAAERAYLEAIEIYERAPDTPPGDFSDFLTDLGLLRLTRGRAADAVPPLRRAAELREATAGESAVRRANALSNLATAHFESGDLAAASRDYARAVDLRLAASAD
jgi:tetratricopeptide (TPR) repeat protein